MGWFVLLGIVGLAVLWVIVAYNGLISLKNQKDNGWKQIDVQLKEVFAEVATPPLGHQSGPLSCVGSSVNERITRTSAGAADPVVMIMIGSMPAARAPTTSTS